MVGRWPDGGRVRLAFRAADGLLGVEEWEDPDGPGQLIYTEYTRHGRLLRPAAIRLLMAGEWYAGPVTHWQSPVPDDLSRFDAPPDPDHPWPSMQDLIEGVGARQDEMAALLDRYAYTETHYVIEIDRQGTRRQEEAERYEISHHKGQPIRRLVARKGRPLSARDERKAQSEAAKRIQEIDSTADSPPGERRGGQRSVTIDGDSIRAWRFFNPRRETLDGQSVVGYDFEPDRAFRSRDKSVQTLQKLTGTLWLDETEAALVRLEAWFTTSYKVGAGILGAIRPGSSIRVRQERVDRQIWLPSEVEIDINARALLFGVKIRRLITYGQYQKFSVESEWRPDTAPDPVNPARPHP